MALKKFVERLTKPVEELDRANLRAFCEAMQTTPIVEVEPRIPARVAGEVKSVRIVPRAGADALEVVMGDGEGTLIGVFLGRRKISGISPGRRIVFEGVAVRERDRKQLEIFNPIYTLI